MRMRRNPDAVAYLDEAKCLIEPEGMAGKWKEKLGGKALHVEIGTGKGGYSLELAKMHPDEAFIAVERNDTAAGLAARRYDEEGLPNLALIHADAGTIETWFADGEVDVIHLNFSDPWPKKRNAKRRLSSKSFLEAYKKILAREGELIQKTDNPDLFDYSLETLQENGFAILAEDRDFRSEPHEEDPCTEYETKFMQQGQPIYRLTARLDPDQSKEVA